MHNGRYIIHIAGPGRCGKDTIAATLRDLVEDLRYVHSTSYTAAPFLYQAIKRGEFEHEELNANTYKTLHECYNARNESQYMRKIWAGYIDKLNERTGTELYRMTIDNGNDILTGIRKVREITSCIDQGIIDLNIWVCNRLNVQNLDVTQEYGPEICDFIFLNEPIVDEKLRLATIRRKLTSIINLTKLKWIIRR